MSETSVNSQNYPCWTGYFLNNLTKKCEICPMSCSNCSDGSTCNVCYAGYLLNAVTKLCAAEVEDTTRATRDTIIVTTVLCSAFSVVIIAFCLLFFKKARDRNQSPKTERDENNHEATLAKQENKLFSESVQPIPQNNTETCSICLNLGPDVISSCKHEFHAACLRDWYNRRPRCPNCNTQHIIFKIICDSCKNYSQPVHMCKGSCPATDHVQECLKAALKAKGCQFCINKSAEKVEGGGLLTSLGTSQTLNPL